MARLPSSAMPLRQWPCPHLGRGIASQGAHLRCSHAVEPKAPLLVRRKVSQRSLRFYRISQFGQLRAQGLYQLRLLFNHDT